MKLRFSDEMDKNIPEEIIGLTLIINCTLHYPKRLLMKLRFSNEMDKNIPKDIIGRTLINCTLHYPKGCYAHKSELMLVTAGCGMERRPEED